MNVAFYAPMKPPDSDVPSGDRETARMLLAMLRGLGHEVEIASRLVTWSREPGAGRLDELVAASRAELERLKAGGLRPDLWFTYHLYHKAPDWLGPLAAREFAIPYVVAEASRAAKRETGPWAPWLAAADAALDAADAVAAVHAEDARGVEAKVGPGRFHMLPPAIDASTVALRQPGRCGNGVPVLITVAMMRPGDKLASYRLLGEALSRLLDLDWRLLVVGDGPSRDEALAALPADRLHWRGRLPGEEVRRLYAQADIFVWPAVNEAYGMALLEAQAAGLPAVAGRSGGVGEIAADGETALLAEEGDAGGFAAALRELLERPERREAMGQAAAARASARHDIAVVRERLGDILSAATRRHEERRGKAVS